MSEIMDKADVLERYARYQAAETEPTLVRDAFSHLLAQLDAQAATIAGLREALRGLLTFCPADTEKQDRLVLAARAALTRQP